MNVLSESDLAHFRDQGYVIVRDAVPPENRQAVIDALFQFLEMDPANPDDWYRLPLTPGGMVEMYQDQSLWDNRQAPRIHGAMTDLFGTEKLWVSMDRANLKPPFRADHPEYDHKGFTHWDMDTTKLASTPFGVQGVLYLTDTTDEMGGFTCVPGFHNDLEEWIKDQPETRNPRAPDLSRLPENRKVIPVAGKAGDFVIWDRRLAHGNGRNLSDKPRLAQYITMFLANDANTEFREQRVSWWRDRTPPPYDWVVGDPRNREPLHGTTAELTPLGRKLLGLDDWGT